MVRVIFVKLEAVSCRLWQALDHPRSTRLALWMLPLFAGLLSMQLGQDRNWDLRNYHWYNAYAFLNGKIGFDLAPAQFQTYFNPTIDLLYYALANHLPTRITSFIMGTIHGVNFVVLHGIVRQVLQAGEPAAAGTSRNRLSLILALFGCMGTAFLSQLGNTMGDNLTSLLVLSALLVLLKQWPALLQARARGMSAAVLAGLMIGIACGLKLTNAGYALAMCLALLGLKSGIGLRLRISFVFALGVLSGIAVSAGHWYWKMWQVFGNPLFPQFNDKFQGPLAAPVGVADTGWLPKGWLENILWPFIFTFNPRRVIELPMTQIIWPIVYIAFIVVLLKYGRRAILGTQYAGQEARVDAPAARMVLVFFAISYVIWLNLFGVYRYLVPLEMLAPLAFWLLLHRLCAPPVARLIASWCLALAALAGIPSTTWGHDPHAASSFKVDVPTFAEPEQSMVFTVQGDPPMGWMVPYFPKRLAFVSLGSGFPESQGYRDKVASMVASRRGPMYMMVTATGLAPGLQAVATRVAEPDDAQPYMQATANGFALVRADSAAANANRNVLDAGQEMLQRYGLAFREGSCVVYAVHIGAGNEAYQLCEVVRKPAP